MVAKGFGCEHGHVGLADANFDDPLLQPYQLKHLTIRNRVFSSSHEPAYSVNGMPSDRYRLYHVEKAKGGIGMTMTAGSAVVAEDSPPAFGNLHAYKDEIVPFIRRMTDEIHEHGAACMIQITHLGRRTGWAQDDWLPIVSASPVREPAHRNIPKQAEDWDIERIVGKYADAAERMQAGGMDGVEIEAYGHLFDQFLSPLTNRRDDEWGGEDGRRRFGTARADGDPRAGRCRVHRRHPDGDRRDRRRRHRHAAWGSRRCDSFEAAGLIDFINVIRGHIEHESALTEVIPIHGMRSVPHLDFAGMVREHTNLDRAARLEGRRRRVGAVRDPRGQGRSRRHDPRPPRRPAHRAQDHRGPRGRDPARASAPPTASTGSTPPARRCACTTRRPAASRRCRT